ncbi:hypothetical protein L3V86_08775 [Thiotrichales bacterium 19S11-10]|nr:hypothetical protein [Thiotrichales bacterium 19S11-10]
MKWSHKLGVRFFEGRSGIHSKLYWFDGIYEKADKIILEHILPMAEKGLSKLKVNQDDINYFMDVIRQRVSRRLNPSDWQKKVLKAFNGDFNQMVLKYYQNQLMNIPFYQWEV